MLYAYAIGILIAGIINTFFGSAVFLKSRKSAPNIIYGFLSLAIAVWCYSWFAMLLVNNNDSLALFFGRLLNFGAVFIPVFYFHWILSVLKIDGKQKKNLFFGYVLTAFFAILSWTPYYISGVHSILFFPYWPTAGFLYIWYLIFGYFIFAGYGVFILIKSFFKSDAIRRNQIKYVILGSLIGFGAGAVNFFLMYKINPFGSFGDIGIFVSLGLFIPFTIPLAYATIKYELMDIKIVFTEIMAGLVAITLFIDFVFSFLSSGLVLVTIFKSIVFLIFAYLGFSLVKGVLREMKYREEIKKAYEVEKKSRKIEEQARKDIQKSYEKEKQALEIESKAKKELERVDKAKNQFLMATQHHLRTPLTSMRGYVDLILTGTYGKVPKRIKETLLKFEKSTQNEIKIVNELLDVSQFQLGKVVTSLKPGVILEPIIKDITEDVSFEVERKKLYLKIERNQQTIPLIKADADKLRVALTNLVDNAIKYTEKGGITIKLNPTDHKVQIIVKDTGMGIPKEDILNLFARIFERNEMAQKTNTTGKGIGLYLTAKIIEEHHGRIWAESDGVGKGSTFFVELPVE